MLAVNTSKAHKQLSDAIGNEDETLVDSKGRVPDGDQSRDELEKTLDSAKKTLKDRESVPQDLHRYPPPLIPRSRRCLT